MNHVKNIWFAMLTETIKCTTFTSSVWWLICLRFFFFYYCGVQCDVFVCKCKCVCTENTQCHSYKQPLVLCLHIDRLQNCDTKLFTLRNIVHFNVTTLLLLMRTLTFEWVSDSYKSSLLFWLRIWCLLMLSVFIKNIRNSEWTIVTSWCSDEGKKYIKIHPELPLSCRFFFFQLVSPKRENHSPD